MFEVLSKCFEELEKPSYTPKKSNFSQKNNDSLPPRPEQNESHIISQSLPDLESFKYMTLSEAAKQHKIVDRQNKAVGDIKTAYKCFEEYANPNTTIRNQIIAKYYKAYYISRGLVDSPKDKDKIVAQLFKE